MLFLSSTKQQDLIWKESKWHLTRCAERTAEINMWCLSLHRLFNHNKEYKLNVHYSQSRSASQLQQIEASRWNQGWVVALREWGSPVLTCQDVGGPADI